MAFLIAETTKEEREKIVEESLGNLSDCDGCMGGLAEMYQDYIDGKKELSEINMAFRANYYHDDDMPHKESCPINYGDPEFDLMF
ncbi:MAG: purine biosynthesis protein PurH [Clostridia bacterium]|nr:purine biosynthesis protein PurH [Clostridia bacterium]